MSFVLAWGAAPGGARKRSTGAAWHITHSSQHDLRPGAAYAAAGACAPALGIHAASRIAKYYRDNLAYILGSRYQRRAEAGVSC